MCFERRAVERANRTLKDATVNRYHYWTSARLRTHPGAFMAAHNFAKRPEILRDLASRESVCKTCTA
jgi:hypothetical protein